MVPADSAAQAEPDLRTVLEAAGFGDFIDSGRLVILPAGTKPYELITVPRDALAVALNYAYHAGVSYPDPQLREALDLLNAEMMK